MIFSWGYIVPHDRKLGVIFVLIKYKLFKWPNSETEVSFLKNLLIKKENRLHDLGIDRKPFIIPVVETFFLCVGAMNVTLCEAFLSSQFSYL